MIGRFGYEQNPQSLDAMVTSIRGQIAAQPDPTFRAAEDGVVLGVAPMLELLERFIQLERMVAEIPAMVAGARRSRIDRMGRALDYFGWPESGDAA